MNKVDEWIKIDRLNPIIRFETITPAEDRETCNEILMVLHAIDEVITKSLMCNYSYYVQDDLSIQYILSNTVSDQLNEKKLKKSMMLLDFSKLIYRFTCAKKFRVDNDEIVQMRINSWGKQYLEEKKIISQNMNQYNRILEFYRTYFNDHQAEYLELLDLLNNLMWESALRVQKLNEKLCVKILI